MVSSGGALKYLSNIAGKEDDAGRGLEDDAARSLASFLVHRAPGETTGKKLL
jgi:hypothetical protein